MGMAASQVRFLSLQNRKNTIGMNLLSLSNRKTALSRDMNRVAAKYNEAMNQKNLKWSNDDGTTYKNLSYDLLMKPTTTQIISSDDVSIKKATGPYSISTCTCQIVIDDNKITILDSTGAEKTTDTTYRKLATMISEYTSNGTPATDNVTFDSSGNAIKGGSLTDNQEYKILSPSDGYKFDDTLRLKLMKELGLITKDDIDKYTALRTQLYGTKEASDASNNSDYTQILKAFDSDKDAATEKYRDYSVSFGTIKFTDDSLNLNGGCALGNLALAKAYQKEYQAYLNTPLATKLMDDNTISTSDYKYDEISQTGYSSRTDGLIKAITGKSAQTQGLFSGLAFVDGSGVAKDFISLYCLNHSDDPNFAYDDDNCGEFGQGLGNSYETSIIPTTWAQFYDHDGTDYTSISTVTTGSNPDGYFYGKDYIDNPSNNRITGVVIEYDSKQAGTGQDGGLVNAYGCGHIETLVDMLTDSLKTHKNINEDALKYAAEMTKKVYGKD